MVDCENLLVLHFVASFVSPWTVDCFASLFLVLYFVFKPGRGYFFLKKSFIWLIFDIFIFFRAIDSGRLSSSIKSILLYRDRDGPLIISLRAKQNVKCLDRG